MGINEIKNEAKTEIVPSIIIGIGGTGCDIVRETKKRISKVYGNLPIIQYLVFDTDFKTREGVIEEGEFVRLTVEHADDYIKAIDEYSELKAWWPPDLYHIGDVTEGAKQIRPIGRFALFRNIAMIRNIIQARLDYIRQPNHIDEVEREGYSVKRDLKVFIVNSLGGGTGSGMFLDIAFNIRDIVQGVGKINGYTILPAVFKMSEGDRSSVAANTYAALKELDYYMNENAGPEHFFKCNYGVVELDIAKKPFDRYYIIDSESEDHFVSIKYDDAVQAIANSIFLDVTSSVGLAADAMTANIELKLTRCLDSENRRYVMAYASMGLYSLYYPAPEIKEACTYRYAESLVDEIIRPIEGIDDIIKSSLNDITTRSEVKFEIADLANMLYSRKFEMPAEIGGVSIETIEDDRLESMLRGWSLEEERRIEGTISVEIKKERENALEKAKKYLENEIEAVVEDSSKGLAVGKGVIDALEEFITAHLEVLKGEGEEQGEDGQIVKSEKELKESKELSEKILEDLKTLISSRLVLFKADKIKKYTNAYLSKYVEYLNKYVELIKEKEIMVFYTEMLNVLSDLRSNLDNIERKLGLLKKDFGEAKERMLHRLHTESSNFQLEKWIGVTKENIESIYEKYEKPLKESKNEVCQNVLYDWKDYDSKDIRAALLRVSKKQYANLKMNIRDVLPDLESIIKDINEKAKVQITWSGIGIQRHFEIDKMIETVNILGVPGELRAKVMKIVSKVVPDPSRFRVIQTKDETRISNVIYKYAIPLMGMEPVTRLKIEYERAIATKERPLHIIGNSNLEEII